RPGRQARVPRQQPCPGAHARVPLVRRQLMQVTFRPLPTWPHKPTVNREYSRFDTPYPKTLALLEREVGFLGGRDVVMGVGLNERDIRLDGQPRANARAFGHPGVEISFNSREHGRLSYSSDQYLDW